MEKNSQFARSDMRKSAADIEWSRKDASLEEVFGEVRDDDMRKKNSSLTASIESCNETLNAKLSEDSVVDDLISNTDILNGEANRTGVNSTVLKYILYNYEIDYFDAETPNDQDRLVFFHNESNNLELHKLEDEHIFTTNGQADRSKKIGNLALLSMYPEYDIDAENMSFDIKRKEYYQEDDHISDMISSGLISNPADEYGNMWKRENITERSERIAEYIDYRW
jgi:hypothetical protein